MIKNPVGQLVSMDLLEQVRREKKRKEEESVCVCVGGGGDRLSIARMLGGSEFVDPNQMKIDRVYLRVGTSASLRLG